MLNHQWISHCHHGRLNQNHLQFLTSGDYGFENQARGWPLRRRWRHTIVLSYHGIICVGHVVTYIHMYSDKYWYIYMYVCRHTCISHVLAHGCCIFQPCTVHIFFHLSEQFTFLPCSAKHAPLKQCLLPSTTAFSKRF